MWFSLTFLAVSIAGVAAQAQDNVRGGADQSSDRSILRQLTYDILVDGNLDRDNPAT